MVQRRGLQNSKGATTFESRRIWKHFLGPGGFHLEKILIACIGKFLEESGAENVFTENEVFGPGVVKTVMNGIMFVVNVE